MARGAREGFPVDYPLMNPRSPSNDTLFEMVRAIKEESLPGLHRKLDNLNGSVAAVTQRVNVIETWKTTQEAEKGVRSEYGKIKTNFWWMLIVPIVVGLSVTLLTWAIIGRMVKV